MKYIKRYYAIIGNYEDNLMLNELKRIINILVGIEGSAGMQLSAVKNTEWGLILLVRDSTGKNARMLPFAISMLKGKEGYLQCVAISGTLKALAAKLKELGLELPDGMK